MVWALAVIVLLSVGVPAGAWSYTRLRPPPPPAGSGQAATRSTDGSCGNMACRRPSGNGPAWQCFMAARSPTR